MATKKAPGKRPKSGIAGVYYRDDGVPRWEVKIRWTDKDGVRQRLPTRRWPVDPKAQSNTPTHLHTARMDAEAYALAEKQSLNAFDRPLTLRADGWTLKALLERYLSELEDGTLVRKSGKTERSTIRMLLGLGKGPNSNGFTDLVNRPIADLKYQHFVAEKDSSEWPQSLRARLKGSDGNLASNGSVKRVLTVIRGVFKRAQDKWDIALDNPLKSIKGLSVSDGRERTLDEAEWDRVLGELSKHEQGTIDAIVMARYTAARRSEIVNLDWSDINFAKGIARLRNTKSRGEKVVNRDIPLPERAMEVVVRRAQPVGAATPLPVGELAKIGLKGPVFTNDKGVRIRPDSITQAWNRACARAGVHGARLHDLRHTRITELGRFMTASEVARISGHTDLQTFFRYFNPLAEESRKKIDKQERKRSGEAHSLAEIASALAALSTDDFVAAISLATTMRDGDANRK